MLLLIVVIYTWNILLYINIVFGTDYCKFSRAHMLCDGGMIHPRCGNIGQYIYRNITNIEIEDILHSHNQHRNEIALGNVTGGYGKPYPKAANMEELKWDSELANIAAGNVKKCIFKHHCPGSSDCFRTDRHKYVGENSISHRSNGILKYLYKRFDTFQNISDGWFLFEKDLYDPSDLPTYKSETNLLGKSKKNHRHFTQMIWWSTMRLGCAKSGYSIQDETYEYEILIVCYYAPAGNRVGNMYEIGEPCTKCKGSGRICSKKYKGLCAASGRSMDPDPPTSLRVTRKSDHMNANQGSSPTSCVKKLKFLFCLVMLSRIL